MVRSYKREGSKLDKKSRKYINIIGGLALK